MAVAGYQAPVESQPPETGNWKPGTIIYPKLPADMYLLFFTR
jgi:hypothetical protein